MQENRKNIAWREETMMEQSISQLSNVVELIKFKIAYAMQKNWKETDAITAWYNKQLTTANEILRLKRQEVAEAMLETIPTKRNIPIANLTAA